MWNHRPWAGRFLPRSLSSQERLRSYAQWCNAVEGNTTFYATPARSTVETWAAQTEPDFRFVVKLPKPITHERRLTDAGQELRQFLEAMEPLGPRAHMLWVQLPGSFAPGDLGTLAGFLRQLPATHRYGVEVRHRDFFDDPQSAAHLEKVLAETNTEWITFDTTVLFENPPGSEAEHESWSKKPRMPRRVVALTDRPVIRYIGRDDPTITAKGWQPWLDTAEQWLREGRSPTVFMHTPDNAEALTLARRFHDELRSRLPGLEPLPELTVPEPLTLF
jgi:uncharacterized protein YecE (DUF72 family)